MSAKDIFPVNRNQFDIYQCIICSDGLYTEIFAVVNTVFLDIIDADLASLCNGQLVCNYTLSRHIGFSKLSVSDKHIAQCLLDGFYGEGTSGNGLHIERGHRIVKCFTVVRHDGTGFDIRLGTNAGFHNTGIEADTFVVDEESVCSAAAGQTAILIYGDKVISAQIVFAIYIFQFEEYSVIDLTRADRGRVQIQNTGARAVCQIIELLFLFVKNLGLDVGQRIADGSIITVRRCNNAGTADLRQSITIGTLHFSTVLL